MEEIDDGIVRVVDRAAQRIGDNDDSKPSIDGAQNSCQDANIGLPT